MKTFIIIPTKERPLLLMKALTTLYSANETPYKTMVVVDDCPQTKDHLIKEDLQHLPIEIIINDENLGFWGSVTKALTRVGYNDLFFYFGQDVIFDPDWLTHAIYCFKNNFKNDIGLMSFRDDIHNHGNASHGATTKKTLEIVLGHPSPPNCYHHHFFDSELSVKCTDLNIRYYTHDSYVKHNHDPIIEFNPDTKEENPDYINKESRMISWYSGGMDEAKKRLEGAS